MRKLARIEIKNYPKQLVKDKLFIIEVQKKLPYNLYVNIGYIDKLFSCKQSAIDFHKKINPSISLEGEYYFTHNYVNNTRSIIREFLGEELKLSENILKNNKMV